MAGDSIPMRDARAFVGRLAFGLGPMWALGPADGLMKPGLGLWYPQVHEDNIY